jgi:hypothetical protein
VIPEVVTVSAGFAASALGVGSGRSDEDDVKVVGEIAEYVKFDTESPIGVKDALAEKTVPSGMPVQ